MTFAIDPRINADSQLVATRDNFQIRLMDDERFFWVLIIPETEGATEIHDLDLPTFDALMMMARGLGEAIKAGDQADKINTAAIGNVVSQLHLHVIARHRTDPAWPAPVWGHGTPVPASPETTARRVAIINSWVDGNA
ncbi:MAG: HIT family protein [Alphaproteobacteria bacterium]